MVAGSRSSTRTVAGPRSGMAGGRVVVRGGRA